MAWQFDKPEVGEGVIQAFRRPQSSVVSMNFELRGLQASGRYVLTNPDVEGSRELAGEDLLERGLLVTLNQPREAATIFYKLRD